MEETTRMKDPVEMDRGPAWVVLLLVGVSVTLIPMALTGPAVALPSIGRDLHADVRALQRVVNGYNLTFAASMLATGALADRVGRRRVYRLGTGLFGLGTLASELTTLADAKGITVTPSALAWLLAQGDDLVPIPGTRSTQRGAENVAAAHVTLTPEDLARVQEILPHGAAGARYPEAMMPSW
jgi:Major Facilitator Superfamily/Aldo/keto reductase family